MASRPSDYLPDWGRFYLENRRALLACAIEWCGSADAALDVIQEVLVRLIGDRVCPENPRAFALRCVRNLAIDRRRLARNGEVLNAEIIAVGALAEGPIEAAESRDGIRASIAAALAQLVPAQREAIVLRAIAGLTIAEAAEVLQKPAGSIASAYSRGLDQLRQHLATENSHDERFTGTRACRLADH